jgi:DNA polymerase III subunit delta'
MTTETAASHWQIDGHDWAVTFLRKMMQHHRTRHAYLFTGATGIGKNTLAHLFAAALQCEAEDEALRPCGECRSCKRLRSGNHPDLLYAPRDEKSGALKIDAIRDVMRLIALKPFASRYRVAILDDFDSAQDRAQDALLKTLEEPPSQAVLILTAQSSSSLMATITSRCQVLPLRPVPLDTVFQVLRAHGADEDTARLLAQLSSGRVGWALQALENAEMLALRNQALDSLHEALQGSRLKRFALAEELNKLDKPAVRYILEMWQTYWRDVLLVQGSTLELCNIDREAEIRALAARISPAEALQGVRATRRMLQETLYTNASVRLALEIMLLDYPGLQRF